MGAFEVHRLSRKYPVFPSRGGTKGGTICSASGYVAGRSGVHPTGFRDEHSCRWVVAYRRDIVERQTPPRRYVPCGKIRYNGDFWGKLMKKVVKFFGRSR